MTTAQGTPGFASVNRVFLIRSVQVRSLPRPPSFLESTQAVAEAERKADATAANLGLLLSWLLLFAILFACYPALGEDPPNAPHLSRRPSATFEPGLVHNTPSYAPKFRDPAKDWKFWAGTGVLIGATLYDQQKTLDGLKTTGCVEANGGDPHPSRGKLMEENMPVIAGLTVVKYLIARTHRVPWWSYSTGDAVGSVVHFRAGAMWNGCH
jgi:hypothetical protein